MLRKGLIYLILLILPVIAMAGPVGETNTIYTQPDGSSFAVRVYGDEWLRIRTTQDGAAIIKDEDGWWCYAVYNVNGEISSTGHHVGNAPAEIISAARNIPYRTLSSNAARRRSVGNEQALRTIESIRNQSVQTKGSGQTYQKRGLVLLVEFSDVKFKFTKEQFYRLLNEQTGSAKQYFQEQFGQGWEFIFDVSDILTLNWPSSHYGKNDEKEDFDYCPWDMIAQACQLADNTIDFSLYDQDGDNYVDNVYVFYAGLSESEHTDQPDLIWPHQYYIYSGKGINLVLDGKRIDRYACSSEIRGDRDLAGIGSFCHEYAHTLGLMDLYDTDYDEEDGWAAGTWRSTSLMDGGNYNNDSQTPPYFNCIERELLGISQATVLQTGQSYELSPVNENGQFYRLDTDTKDEYYLFECRSNDGWDKYIGGKGMLVYHIDKNLKSIFDGYEYSVWTMNEINTRVDHQCADLIEADGRSDRINSLSDLKGNISEIFFPTTRVTSLGTDGSPQLDFWNGNTSNVSITGIRNVNGKITFNVVDRDAVQGVPSVRNVEYTTFPDAAIITFEASDTDIPNTVAVIDWKKTASDAPYTTIKPASIGDGKYACKIEGLESGNVSYEALIRFETQEGVSSSYKLPFMTKRKPGVSWPYIYMPQTRRDNALALHVVGASEASEISWYYDDVPVNPGKDYIFRPDASGVLKAVVIWEDGSKDIIIKQLNVE